MGNQHIFKINLAAVMLSLMYIFSVLLSSPPFPIVVDFHCIITTLQHFLDCGMQNTAGRE